MSLLTSIPLLFFLLSSCLFPPLFVRAGAHSQEEVKGEEGEGEGEEEGTCSDYQLCNVSCGALQYNNDNIAYLGANDDAGYAHSPLPSFSFPSPFSPLPCSFPPHQHTSTSAHFHTAPLPLSPSLSLSLPLSPSLSLSLPLPLPLPLSLSPSPSSSSLPLSSSLFLFYIFFQKVSAVQTVNGQSCGNHEEISR